MVAVARIIMNHWDWLWMGSLETENFWIRLFKDRSLICVKHDGPLFLLKAPRLCFVNKMLTRMSALGPVIYYYPGWHFEAASQWPLICPLSPRPGHQPPLMLIGANNRPGARRQLSRDNRDIILDHMVEQFSLYGAVMVWRAIKIRSLPEVLEV